MIITDEKILRQKCADASPEEVGEIIEKLEEGLRYCDRIGRPGIGLAAIQIGIHKNVSIIRIDNSRVDLVNCKIVKAYDKEIFYNEGCLSFPDRVENTFRFKEVHVENNLVYPHSFVATDLLAICIQHELDHCNNVLLPDIALPKPKVKTRPNDLCPCGSGVKFKRCHAK